jgi:hypothetical protein
MRKLSAQDIEKEAIEIVKQEIANHDEALFFVTEKVAFSMRPLIRTLRKNYWGIFDVPNDEVTGKKKVWVPFTRLIVDSVRKNADLDTKNIGVRAKRKAGIIIISLVRGFLRMWSRSTRLGEALNTSILDMCIDGTVVWKTIKVRDGNKLRLVRKTVDLLNIYIDPTAENIQEAYRFTERSLMTPDEIASMDWMNNKDITGKKNLHRSEKDLMASYDTGEYVDVYEMWGKIPEYLITGRKFHKKPNESVDARIVVSGLETGDMRVHVLKRNTEKDKEGNTVKPYEEARFIKVTGRWYGVGPAESVMMLQEWLNEIINLRRNKNRTASLGLFKVKSSAGVTQQMLSNLVSSGVISLNNLDDLDNFPIEEAGQSSYNDEEVAKQWGFEVTSTFDIARGAPLPASATATGAVIEDRNTKSAFILVKESFGQFLERWIDRGVLPNITQLMKQEDTITIFNDFEEIEKVRERVVAALAMETLDKQKRRGSVPTEEELRVMMDRADKRLRDDGDLFFDQVDKIIANQYDAHVFFTNEEMDIGVTVRNLIEMTQFLPPEAQRDFTAQALDLLGLEVPESLRGDAATQAFQQLQQTGEPPQLSEQQLVTAANTLGNEGR